jgi:hypothetical protein
MPAVEIADSCGFSRREQAGLARLVGERRNYAIRANH